MDQILKDHDYAKSKDGVVDLAFEALLGLEENSDLADYMKRNDGNNDDVALIWDLELDEQDLIRPIVNSARKKKKKRSKMKATKKVHRKGKKR
jgi:hypothetical protein